jgi:hypothetical protein
MLHKVTRREAEFIREAADGVLDAPGFADGGGRIFRPPLGDDDGPIAPVAATGRANCRECGERIAAGVDAVVFGFSPTGSIWAAGRAYVHAAPCRDYPEEDD